jgi:hypothetical protein
MGLGSRHNGRMRDSSLQHGAGETMQAFRTNNGRRVKVGESFTPRREGMLFMCLRNRRASLAGDFWTTRRGERMQMFVML